MIWVTTSSIARSHLLPMQVCVCVTLLRQALPEPIASYNKEQTMNEQELLAMDKQELIDILLDLNPDQEDCWDYDKHDLTYMILELL